MTQPIVAVRFCTNRDKALRELELRQTTKKVFGAFRLFPTLSHWVSRENHAEAVRQNCSGSCNKTT